MKKYLEVLLVMVFIPLLIGLVLGSSFVPYIVHSNIIYVSASLAGLVYYLIISFGKNKE